MAIQHWQHHCRACGRPTLHVRSEADVNHVLHLLVSVFLCGTWLPIWFLITLRHALTAGEVWRCQNCGSAPLLLSGPAPVAMRAVKPAGPSTRAKAKGDKCPKCGQAMVAGLELGAELLSCGRCGETFERAS